MPAARPAPRPSPRRAACWAVFVSLSISPFAGPLDVAAAAVTDISGLRFERVVIDPYEVPSGHKPTAIADVDGDGYPDIVAYTDGRGLSWYGHPTWTRTMERSTDGSRWTAAP